MATKSSKEVKNELLKKALNRPSGAKFYRCSLQVNPFHYMKTYRKQDHGFKSESDYNEALVAKAQELDIQVLGVTDHNHVGSVDALAAEAFKAGIVVFPGFEIESSEGVHLLCLFEKGTKQQTLDRYLGELGIDETNFSTKLSSKNIGQICEMVVGKGGLTIAAHITESKGLLYTLKQQTAIKAWTAPHLHAVQIPAAIDALPPDKKPIVENKNADYKRSTAPSKTCAIAVINCKDIAEPKDLADPSATCQIKMSTPTIEGLRQAFLDPDSRIRLNSDAPIPDHAYIIAFAANGGFLGDLAIQLNSDLNVLIGGRGAGKSTVIEAIRYTLGLTPLGADAKETHDLIIKDVVKSGTQLSVLLYSPSPSPRGYVIERTHPNPPVVKSEDGTILDLRPVDVVKGIEIFGQHEIGDLTRDPSKITKLLDRFIKDGAGIDAKKSEHLLGLQISRSEILQRMKSISNLKEKVDQLPAMEEEFKRFAEAGLEKKLKDKSDLIKEGSAIKSAKDLLETAFEEVNDCVRSLDLEPSALEPGHIKDLPGKLYLEKIQKMFGGLAKDISKFAEKISERFDKAREDLDSAEFEWKTSRKTPVESAYAKILKELQKEAIDADAFVELQEKIEELKPARTKSAGIEKEIKGLIEKRRAVLDQYQAALQEDFQSKSAAAKKVSKRLNHLLRVEVDFCGDKGPLLALLKEKVGGRLSEMEKGIRGNEDFSLVAFVSACRQGIDAVERYSSSTKDQAKRLVEKGEDLFMQIEELSLPHTTNINLNVSSTPDTPDWKPMGRLSKGQKATALLLLLLQETEAPLVIDQPEDDLDNQFIADGIVPRMREEKMRRQFIFSTHNANLPVLGDAELIVGLTAEGEAGGGTIRSSDEATGSIDSTSVQKIVETVLEGGRTAFETRRRKYGF